MGFDAGDNGLEWNEGYCEVDVWGSFVTSEDVRRVELGSPWVPSRLYANRLVILSVA